eukprot:maker-scaffold585_size130225-snap-gene-0.23 protein:Tk05224 transcript:maker-scaffold585_size130225-snap-gene-0.23-mRNA-1 annotation:"predicted protein"
MVTLIEHKRQRDRIMKPTQDESEGLPPGPQSQKTTFELEPSRHILPGDRDKYAKLNVCHSNYVPAQMDRHLGSMTLNSAGHLWVSASSLTGRYWTGSLWYFLVPPTEGEGTIQPARSLTGTDTDHGVTHIIPYGNSDKQVLIGLDNGSLEHHCLSFSENGTGENAKKNPSYYFLDKVGSFQEHDDIVSGLSVTCDQRHVVTASHDKSLVIWDNATLAKTQGIPEAHLDIILAQDSHGKDANLIATASQDGRVALWDIRQAKVKQVVYNNQDAAPCALQFVPKEDHFLVVGSKSGEISLLDLRKADTPLAKNGNAFQDRIHEISFSPRAESNLFAISADNKVFKDWSQFGTQAIV